MLTDDYRQENQMDNKTLPEQLEGMRIASRTCPRAGGDGQVQRAIGGNGRSIQRERADLADGYGDERNSSGEWESRFAIAIHGRTEQVVIAFKGSDRR
jgi:hypothetical protein